MFVFTEPIASGRRGVPFPAVDRNSGIHLDRVAKLRARAVGLKVINLGWDHAGPLQRRLDHPLLRRTVGNRRAGSGAVLVHGRAADDAPDAVAVGLCVGKPLEHDHAATFAAHKPIRCGIKGAALAV